MAIGILTECGITITSAPVLTDNETSLFFFRRSKMNKKINELDKFTGRLKAIEALKGRKAIKA